MNIDGVASRSQQPPVFRCVNLSRIDSRRPKEYDLAKAQKAPFLVMNLLFGRRSSNGSERK